MESGGFQIGRAVVGTEAKNSPDCKQFIGKAATGRANGCHHDDCTEAKNNARANLRNSRGLRDEKYHKCHQYIKSTKPCDVYHC